MVPLVASVGQDGAGARVSGRGRPRIPTQALVAITDAARASSNLDPTGARSLLPRSIVDGSSAAASALHDVGRALPLRLGLETGYPWEVLAVWAAAWAPSTLRSYESLLPVIDRLLRSAQLSFADIVASPQLEVVPLQLALAQSLPRSTILRLVSLLRHLLGFVSQCPWTPAPATALWLQGLHRLAPAKRKYDSVWDIAPVLQQLAELGAADSLNEEVLREKCIMLVLLLTGLRVSDVARMWFPSCSFDDDDHFLFRVRFAKQSMGRTELGDLSRMAPYPEQPSVCPVTHLRRYFELTSARRSALGALERYLFISLASSRVVLPLARNTIATIVRSRLTVAGVPAQFGPHSTRHASTSAAAAYGLSMDDIMAHAKVTHATLLRHYIVRPAADQYGPEILRGALPRGARVEPVPSSSSSEATTD